ncbi:hypothetical protein SAMN05216503_2794 [Polaribacter sp. KT25b]|uniref:FEKKY domain-containing protein n=1 Tax=Polaribacter sp. KT25b TaxID=1855336 RepID=UPI00087D3870|nr:hypothetical protein [Polaribacter sp. KT25b]SDS35524.1 hypothetical protein SAMN05216503_2794 [Polaribacter sp. KT25b]
MKLKTSIIILILSSLVIYLLFSNSNVRNINNFNLLLNISAILIVIGIIGFIIYLIAKESRKIKNITIGLVFISLAINSYVGFYKYQMNKRNKILSEYYELKSCKEMETRFASDLKKEEIKYFFYGIGYDTELAKILDNKYKIETFGMGCLIQSEFECYNNLVYKYLKESHNETINDIYRKIDNE